MSFQPVLPMGGVGGWRFLERTGDRQLDHFAAAPMIRREMDYFRARIGSVESAADLVADRRLLRIALTAYGLGAEADKPALIRKVLEEGTEDPGSLANRLVNRSFRAFAQAFGFGNAEGARLDAPGFVDNILARYRAVRFEEAIASGDETMATALRFRREIGEIAGGSGSERARWFTILGQPALRRVIEGALNLPPSFGRLAIDRQYEDVAARMRRLVGDDDPAILQDPAVVEQLVTRYLARAQSKTGPSALTPGFGALTLLQAAPQPPAADGMLNLLLARARR